MIKLEDFYEILDHRPGIDPEGLRVGILTPEDKAALLGYFINENNEIFKYNPNKNWIDISQAYGKVPKGFIFVRYSAEDSKFIFKNFKSGNILKESIKSLSYPSISFGVNNKYFQLPIHIIVARLYIPRLSLDNRVTVDHIDRNRRNFSLENLRFATLNVQSKNQNRKRFNNKKLLIDLSREEILRESPYPNINLKTLFQYMSSKQEKYKFITITETGYNLYKNKIISNPDILYKDTYWKSTKLFTKKGNEIFVNKEIGLIKFGNRITEGIKRNKNGRVDYIFSIFICSNKHKRIALSRLIYFSINEDKSGTDLLDSIFDLSLEIDHINSDSSDNSPINLRSVSHRENMRNKNTKLKMSNIIVQFDGENLKIKNIFCGSRDAEKATNLKHQGITISCNNPFRRRCGGDFFLYEKDLESNFFKIEKNYTLKVIYQMIEKFKREYT